MPTNEEQAKAAGRGGLAVLGAKVFFIATGLLQQMLLPRAIGLADYGALSRVLAISNVLNNVVVGSATQGVSRFSAAAGALAPQVLRVTLRVHGALALVASLLFALAAPWVAHFEHAEEVKTPLVVMAGVLLVYGVYAPLVGYLNGRGKFGQQALLDVAAATLRTLALLAFGYVFTKHAGVFAASLSTSPGVFGATCGMVVAALAVFAVALRFTGTGAPVTLPRPAAVPAARDYLTYLLPLMVAQLFTNGLMQTDLILLGRYASLSARASGFSPQAANEWVAVYRACQLFAFLPYQMLFSVTQVLFPMLARANAEEGRGRVTELVARGSRMGAVVCGGLLVLILAMPASFLALAYGHDVAVRGAATLRVLALGQGAFAMFGLAATVLVSLGRVRTAMAMTASALALLIVTCLTTLPYASFGSNQLAATALATTLTLFVSLAGAAVAIQRVAGAFVPWKTSLRVGACVALAYALGGGTPLTPSGVMPLTSRALTPVLACAVAAAYGLALFATGEIGKADLATARSIVSRRVRR